MTVFLILFSVFLGLSLAALSADNLKWEADCNNINPAAKTWIDNKIATSKIYMIGMTWCHWCHWAKEYMIKMGFSDADIIVDNVDAHKFDIWALLTYSYCQYTQYKTVPQVFLNKKFIGGSEATRMAYYTGAGTKAALDTGVIDQIRYKMILMTAARDFVNDAVESTKGYRKYFMFSKTKCPHCVIAKNCLKNKKYGGSVEIHEINDFETHDEIKAYKKELTGSPYTPLLIYNGKVLMNQAELEKVSGC